jgi:hypothetical protein
VQYIVGLLKVKVMQLLIPCMFPGFSMLFKEKKKKGGRKEGRERRRKGGREREREKEKEREIC